MSKKHIYLFFAIALLLPPFARAAMLGVSTSPSAVVGQSFQVNITLDTQGDSVNAIQGELTYPSDRFMFQGINDGASPVSLWIDPPREVSSGTIAFSGIVPGGFLGSANSVVGVILVPITGGKGTIALNNAELLKNDGQGSEIPLTTEDQTIMVAGSPAAATNTWEGLSFPFTVPGNFTPVIARDPNVYGGRYFLVFSTTDKGSGINHYEVLEAPAGTTALQSPPWPTATSPYLLKDQTLSSDVYVRAVSNAGSATIVEVPARTPRNAFSALATWISVPALLLVILIAVLWSVRFRKKRRAP